MRGPCNSKLAFVAVKAALALPKPRRADCIACPLLWYCHTTQVGQLAAGCGHLQCHWHLHRQASWRSWRQGRLFAARLGGGAMASCLLHTEQTSWRAVMCQGLRCSRPPRLCPAPYAGLHPSRYAGQPHCISTQHLLVSAVHRFRSPALCRHVDGALLQEQAVQLERHQPAALAAGQGQARPHAGEEPGEGRWG